MTTKAQINRLARTMTIRPAYAVSATAFALLAWVRAGQDELGWSGLFVLAALVNAWLAIQPGRTRAQPSPVAAPTQPSEVALRRARSWTVLASTAIVLAVLLVAVDPASAVLAALTALGAMLHARRLRHGGRLESMG